MLPVNLVQGLGAHALVIGVGAFRHDMIELPPALVSAAQVFVDDPEGAQTEAGDLLAAGLSAPQTSLQDLVMGHAPLRDGRVRPLAMTTMKRSTVMPQASTPAISRVMNASVTRG